LPNSIFSCLKIFRPRFSLRTLLLLTTIVALGVALWRVGSEVVPLRVEVRKLRNELGILQIDESEKIYAIRVEANDDQLHKFRVYLPKGKQYSVNYAYSGIPIEGQPASAGSQNVEAGEYLITVRIRYRPNLDSGEPSPYASAILRVTPSQGQRFSSSVSNISIGGGSGNSWIANQEIDGRCGSIKRIDRQVEISEPDQPVDLLRIRSARPINIQRGADGNVISYSHETIEEPCDGFMIWIE